VPPPQHNTRSGCVSFRMSGGYSCLYLKLVRSVDVSLRLQGSTKLVGL
jgi:hypothetical protein